MGITKSEIFTEKQNLLATYFKVLAHPARIAILQLLMEKSDCVCGGLSDSIGLAQPTISQHLKELKSIGLIQGNIAGTSVCYCINQEKLKEITWLFTSFLSNAGEADTEPIYPLI
ncbi:MAG: winged helix-turn-helix transcriptional regulator [Saprospiraceae bacterium]|nr:winged helix-turn-helix transcriptional regulator [Saprospiraceae bacterium]